MNLYFSGIGGSGIGPLAEIALDAGYIVTGSDPNPSPYLEALTERGVNITHNQDGSYLQALHEGQPVDWLIYTSALPKDHPELVMAQKLGIKTSKRDELLAKIIQDKNLKLIAVAGTHGKTTTTSMLVFAFQKMKMPVSYLVGTTLSFGPSGKFDSESQFFIYECDEYDRNFLHYQPYLSLIPSLDYDHPDTYPTESDYLQAFREFATNSRLVIAWKDQQGDIFEGMPNVQLLEKHDCNSIIELAGEHNRRNASIAQKALIEIGIQEKTDELFSTYPGSSRRFEKLANNLYSDYGHHPSEISATLELASELSDKIVLVYQPHQNIRQHKIMDTYTNQFELAHHIYWLPTYLTREDPGLPVLEPQDLVKNITNKKIITFSNLDNELWNQIQKQLADGALVVVMGAGNIDSWVHNKLDEIM